MAKLGFPVPGVTVLDPARATHRAVGLQSSVFASLVTPFQRHLRTFGAGALLEALRVSLMNAKLDASHGSSWQQGGTLVLHHEEDVASGGAVSLPSDSYDFHRI